MLKINKGTKLVIKIGSSLLVEKGKIRKSWLDNLVKEVAILQKQGVQVVIVSSGAIALGKSYLKKYLKTDFEVKDLAEKQATAAIGQINLMSEYKNSFDKKNLIVAQILLTAADCSHEKRYLNATNTISTLLQYGFVPIINENDTVAVEEIKIGDNDQLAASVAKMIKADYLILLSDIDGLYDKNPKIHKDAKLITRIAKIDEKIEKMAEGAVSSVGTGGMITKIKAAKIAAATNCQTIITNGAGKKPEILELTKGKKKFSLFGVVVN